MQRLGKNHGGYHGETIDIRSVLLEVETASRHHCWASEAFHEAGEFKWFALHRKPEFRSQKPEARVYISTGIHGDEPAGPLAALQLLQENRWPENADIFLLPCLNPAGFVLNRRENEQGIDLNRQYLNPSVEATRAHIAWLERQPKFDLSLCLHEDWETQGFYVYELNPDNRASIAEKMVERVGKVCPIDPSEIIEGRAARNGIIRPGIDPRTRPDWPEAFYLITYKTRLSCTLEAPSDYPLAVRVAALAEAVKTALQSVSERGAV